MGENGQEIQHSVLSPRGDRYSIASIVNNTIASVVILGIFGVLYNSTAFEVYLHGDGPPGVSVVGNPPASTRDAGNIPWKS